MDGAGAYQPVPGEGGEAMEPALAQFLAGIGEKARIPKFQEKHLTTFDSLKLMTKKTLIDVLDIPDAKAGLLVSRLISLSREGEVVLHAPSTRARARAHTHTHTCVCMHACTHALHACLHTCTRMRQRLCVCL